MFKSFFHAPSYDRLHGESHFATAEEQAAAEQALAATDRCHIKPYEDTDGRTRHLLVQFRRQPGDAAKRILI